MIDAKIEMWNMGFVWNGTSPFRGLPNRISETDIVGTRAFTHPPPLASMPKVGM
jgi:hypothetical protein